MKSPTDTSAPLAARAAAPAVAVVAAGAATEPDALLAGRPALVAAELATAARVDVPAATAVDAAAIVPDVRYDVVVGAVPMMETEVPSGGAVVELLAAAAIMTASV